MKKILKIFGVNCLFLLSFTFLLEVALRFLRTYIDCTSGYCNTYHFKIFTSFGEDLYQRSLSEKHSDLGYVPKTNLSMILNQREWNNVKISTDKNGLRNSTNNSSNKSILTTGDSFVFGNGVSDDKTFQSCLNINQKDYKFINAGVYGYGTSQSLLRAKLLIPKIQPDKLIISTLVGSNFSRDRLTFKSGFPMPSVVKVNNKLKHELPQNYNVLGSKFSSRNPPFDFLDFLVVNSKLINKLFPHFRSNEISILKRIITIENKKSPPKNEIIDWAIENSLNLDIPVIWLLQYQSQVDENIIKEREYLLKKLNKKNIQYIDLYDELHLPERSNKFIKKTWILGNGHHSGFGHELICKKILTVMKLKK